MATISKPKPDPVTSSEKIVGINQAGIAQIKAAIDKYTKIVQDTINVSANTANIEKAIKGTGSEANIKQANKNLTAALNALLTSLNKYKTSLDQVLASYQKSDASNEKVSSKEFFY